MISDKNFLQISKKFILFLALFLFLVRIFCKSVVYGLSISLQKPSILLRREKMEYINRVFHWADHLSDT